MQFNTISFDQKITIYVRDMIRSFTILNDPQKLLLLFFVWIKCKQNINIHK